MDGHSDPLGSLYITHTSLSKYVWVCVRVCLFVCVSMSLLNQHCNTGFTAPACQDSLWPRSCHHHPVYPLEKERTYESKRGINQEWGGKEIDYSNNKQRQIRKAKKHTHFIYGVINKCIGRNQECKCLVESEQRG